MGLDMSIVRSPNGIDFGQLCAVRDAVVDGMDWYLGGDKEKRMENHVMLSEKALLLTRDKVLSDAKVSDRELEYLKDGIEPNQFSIYLSWVIGTIKEYKDKNDTHLSFDWDMLPGITVMESCSWNLRDLFDQCSKPGNAPTAGYISELDVDKVLKMAEKWKKKGFKIKLSKWIGYFLPDTGRAISLDCMRELGINDTWIDNDDLLYYRDEIGKVVDFVKPGYDRLWLISSY